MAVVTVYRHGLRAGIAPRNRDPESDPPARRSVCKGWTAGASRRNLAFLRSVDETRLTGQGFTFTLTLRGCPETSQDWYGLVSAYLKRLRRRGMLRFHRVTEWQRRGVPHLHGIAYFPDGSAPPLVSAWLEVASAYQADSSGQCCKPVYDAVGWAKYLAKHAARGVQHYQRSGSNIPAGWTSTGRLWARGGEWPTVPPCKLEVSSRAFWELRRLARSWRVADSRGDRCRIQSARTMLRCNDVGLSQVRGISEWIPEHVWRELLAHLQNQGREIRCT